MDTPTDPLLPASAAGANRRRTPRFDVRVALVGHLSSGRIRLSNLSAGGCLGYASCVLEREEMHLLRFKDRDGEELRLHARVVHAVRLEGDPDAVCVAGLSFVNPNEPGQRTAIGRLLALSTEV